MGGRGGEMGWGGMEKGWGGEGACMFEAGAAYGVEKGWVEGLWGMASPRAAGCQGQPAAHHFCNRRCHHLAPNGPPRRCCFEPPHLLLCCREIGFIVYALGKPLDPFLQKQYD